jgi:SPP1 family phage portal protein
MELEAAKRLIKEYEAGHSAFVLKADTAERYYLNQNDIIFKKDKKAADSADGDDENPLRNADNRISHNFHGLLVDQKASYTFTYPPLFDVGSSKNNKAISKLLGAKFTKVCKKLCVDASNAGVAWLHYWIDEKDRFRYGVVDSREIIPVWTDELDREIEAVMRTYSKILDDGKRYVIYEIWNEYECESFCYEVSASIDTLAYYSMFGHCIIDISGDGERYLHNQGRVPFIPFFNKDTETGDLDKIKTLIDTYDKVYSGFVNDLEDIQEIIFILSGYGGTDLKEFLHDLKKFKTVKLDSDSDNPGLSTLTIDIPVEAREKLLSMTRKEIFEQGQGIDPQPENYGNASGEALKFMYSLLELKAGLMETEFRVGFEEFVTVICEHLGIDQDDILQTWTRNAIRSESEIATMCVQSTGILSQKTIVRNHPFVDDAEAELKQIAKEKEEAQKEQDAMLYGGAFRQDGQDNDDDDNGNNYNKNSPEDNNIDNTMKTMGAGRR